MENTVITLKLSDELDELLTRNGTNLVRELQKQGLDVERGPAVSGGTGERSAVLTLLAATPLVVAIGNAVAVILREQARGPIILKEGEAVVIPPTNAISTTTSVKAGRVFEYSVEHKVGKT